MLRSIVHRRNAAYFGGTGAFRAHLGHRHCERTTTGPWSKTNTRYRSTPDAVALAHDADRAIDTSVVHHGVQRAVVVHRVIDSRRGGQDGRELFVSR
jgi:hypothetical protein